ncbi:helix-turn-helix transcriptional regulator [Octadecabacter sp. G9-8]|uniref:Helix-turn-helix transcriptional regulator n=1 Tax=Octadecabacter dasysiphoniae TaxID=2909341 RepID=A0ABS9CUS6_9RHOB|nr:helix-turn-helix transcriptional regulator [Octadecabacter dasysiphoniae]MCF2870987.1 helix-turn-helix transcriptional regulator [Octadecabacter dasysiphoniae]
MNIMTLSANDTFAAEEAFVLSRAELDTRRPPHLHTQDFHELVWVQNGTVRLHTDAGKRDLSEGDVLFISPDQRHGLQGRRPKGAQADGEASIVVSLAIRPGVIKAIGNRHEDLAGVAFWAATTEPTITHRDMRQLAALNQAALQLERSPRRKLYLEAFLLPFLVALDRTPEGMENGAPDWLIAACTKAHDPAVFRDGAAGFVAATGRAHPHVSRTMRRFMGLTPSDYINTLRMDHAARQLTGTSDPLPEIAADCGLPNLSHFHKLFLSHMGETPLRYRRARQANLIQPRL